MAHHAYLLFLVDEWVRCSTMLSSGMKKLFYLVISALLLASLSSCSLLNSAAGLANGVGRLAGRTIGVSQ